MDQHSYEIDSVVWVMFKNGDKIGWVPARGIVTAKVVGQAVLLGTRQYAVEVAPGIFDTYDAHQMFSTEADLYEHLKTQTVDR